jgi:hypothetical protein
MLNSKVRAAVLDFMKSENGNDHDAYAAYAAECELFDKHFPGFDAPEMRQYKEFVNWLVASGMIKSDLTIDELYDVMEAQERERNSDDYYIDFI